MTKTTSNKPSASAIALQKKWQDAAIKMGGEGAKIILTKSHAKKLVFDLLRDSFKPMNITTIYKALKAVVPSPVLKSCLDEMVANEIKTGGYDSDEDNFRRSPHLNTSTTGDAFSESLHMKMGRN
eukprot:12542973-Ditylum_brightwellii.AAC.1